MKEYKKVVKDNNRGEINELLYRISVTDDKYVRTNDVLRLKQLLNDYAEPKETAKNIDNRPLEEISFAELERRFKTPVVKGTEVRVINGKAKSFPYKQINAVRFEPLNPFFDSNKQKNKAKSRRSEILIRIYEDCETDCD